MKQAIVGWCVVWQLGRRKGTGPPILPRSVPLAVKSENELNTKALNKAKVKHSKP